MLKFVEPCHSQQVYMQETRPTLRVPSADNKEHDAFATPHLCSHYIVCATQAIRIAAQRAPPRCLARLRRDAPHQAPNARCLPYLPECLPSARRCKSEETIGLAVRCFFGDEAALCIRPNLARLKYVGEVNFWSWSDMYPLMTCCEVDFFPLIL